MRGRRQPRALQDIWHYVRIIRKIQGNMYRSKAYGFPQTEKQTYLL